MKIKWNVIVAWVMIVILTALVWGPKWAFIPAGIFLLGQSI